MLAAPPAPTMLITCCGLGSEVLQASWQSPLADHHMLYTLLKHTVMRLVWCRVSPT